MDRFNTGHRPPPPDARLAGLTADQSHGLVRGLLFGPP